MELSRKPLSEVLGELCSEGSHTSESMAKHLKGCQENCLGGGALPPAFQNGHAQGGVLGEGALRVWLTAKPLQAGCLGRPRVSSGLRATLCYEAAHRKGLPGTGPADTHTLQGTYGRSTPEIGRKGPSSRHAPPEPSIVKA